MSENKNNEKKEVDPELDDLLDSALNDMTKKTEDAPAKTEDGAAIGEVPSMWSQEFINEAASQFETNMATILGSIRGVPEEQITPDQIAETFTKMAEAAAAVLKTSSGDQDSAAAAPIDDPEAKSQMDEVTAAISQTLQNLNSGTEKLQTPFTDQDLAMMFSNFSVAEGDQDTNMFVPFMHGMMQSLLSKEVLFAPLKELVDKYPAWLEENKDKVDPKDYDRYLKQKELMEKVCASLETEQETDSEEVKRQRFEVVLDLMQKMQELGQPPAQMAGELGPPPGFANAPAGADSQCAIM